MFRRRAQAQPRSHSGLRIPYIGRGFDQWRAVRRWTSRSEWGRRLLRSGYQPADDKDGLILIQIDGLSRKQLERAIQRGRMPFLRRLLQHEGYELHTMYSGLPSTTSAVQAELFYAERGAVPAHGFGDRSSGQVITMLNADRAAKVEQRARQKASGLLAGGSAYSNIYTGDAAEPHFCASAMGWGDLFRDVNLWRIAVFIVMHFGSLVRIAFQAFVQLIVALGDVVRGISDLKECLQEIKFIPKRIGVAVVLREIITICACIDATRGVPLVQLNYLGYDEHSHHRGPESRFAQWSLRGIDGCIKKIWNVAAQSERRHYQVWIYADHGQHQVTPYDVVTGRLISDVITDIFRPIYGETLKATHLDEKSENVRASLLRRPKNNPDATHASAPPDDSKRILVASVGPLGHIYLPSPLSTEQLHAGCQQLVRDGQVPVVILPVDEGMAKAWTAQGEFELPRDAAKIFGADHPFLADLGEDLVRVTRHPDAGDILFAGWCDGCEPMSFVYEKGAHGAMTAEECQAFALLPVGTPVAHRQEDYLRPDEFRAAALHARGVSTEAQLKRSRRADSRESLRVMTYNVHCCMGMDGRLSLSRIARVIAQCDADVIALQELDAHRPRSGSRDQAQELARLLGMNVHFHPAISLAQEAYGDAILSRLPMRLRRAAGLPRETLLPGGEPRGAVWVEVDLGDATVQILNTHLGLRPQERREQIDAILGPEWLGHPECQGPIILCGDFNAVPRSYVYRALAGRLRDSQWCVAGRRPTGTWLSSWPVLRIDHIFVSEGLVVNAVNVPRGTLPRVASDHLPLVVDVLVESKVPKESVEVERELVGR